MMKCVISICLVIYPLFIPWGEIQMLAALTCTSRIIIKRNTNNASIHRGNIYTNKTKSIVHQIKSTFICIALFTRKHVTEGFTYAHRTAPQPT